MKWTRKGAIIASEKLLNILNRMNTCFMKSFNKKSLPESVSYKGLQYFLNTDITSAMKLNSTPHSTIVATLKAEGRKCVLVKVLSHNLKKSTDLHGKAYKPSEWIYTTN